MQYEPHTGMVDGLDRRLQNTFPFSFKTQTTNCLWEEKTSEIVTCDRILFSVCRATYEMRSHVTAAAFGGRSAYFR